MAFLDAQIPSWLAPISPAREQEIKQQSIVQGFQSGFQQGIQRREREQTAELRAREFGMRFQLQEQQLNDIKAFTNDLPKITGWRQSLPADPEEIMKAPIPEGIVSPKSLQFIEGIRTDALKNSQILRSNSANTLAIKAALDMVEKFGTKHPGPAAEMLAAIGNDGVLTPEKAEKISQIGDKIRKLEFDEQVQINTARRMTPNESMRNSWFRIAEKMMPTNPEVATRIYGIMGTEPRPLTQAESDELVGITKTVKAQDQAEKQVLELEKIKARGQNRVGADRSLSPEKWAAMQAELRIATSPEQVDAIMAKYTGTQSDGAATVGPSTSVFDVIKGIGANSAMQVPRLIEGISRLLGIQGEVQPSAPQEEVLAIPQVPPENVPRGTNAPSFQFDPKTGKLVPK